MNNMVDSIQNTNQALLHNTAVEKVQQAQQGSPDVQHHLFSKQLQAQEEVKRRKVSDIHKSEDKNIQEKKREERKELTGGKSKLNRQHDEEKKSADKQASKDEEGGETESGRLIDIRV